MPHLSACTPAPGSTPATPSRRHWLLGSLALPLAHGLWALAPATSRARTPGDVLPGRRRPDVATLELLDRDSGRISPVHRHQGQLYVAGQPGARYALRVRNLSPRRLLAVLSVDGVNVVSGETAAWHQTGYVLEPGASLDVTGWRKSDQDVAAFEFAALADSYAARTGRPDNVGVIGVAVFRERVQPQPYYAPPIARENEYDDRYRGRSESKSAPAAAPQASRRAAEAADSASGVGQSIGTGHGQREWAPVSRTDFVRASRTPAQVVQLRYDDIPNLVAMGVMPRPYRYDDGYRRGQPQAFPNGFAADPPGRW